MPPPQGYAPPTVASGGLASATTVSGASLVSAGGVTQAITLVGTQTVSSGGLASATIISSGGIQAIEAGGIASTTQLGSGAQLLVSSGGVVTGATVSNGARETVSSGGVASGTIVVSGGTVTISSGGVASASIISTGGAERIQSGGVASGGTILVGGRQTVSAGGVASATTVADGGTQIVLSGATTTGTMIQDVAGTGGEIVSAGGSAFKTVVTYGSLNILDGGTAISATIDGLERVTGTGIDRSATVRSGGRQILSAGGTAIAASVSSGGRIEVMSGTLSGATIASGGRLDLAHGTASGTIQRGLEVVSAGGIALSGTLIGNGSMVDAGPYLNDGTQGILSGGVASGTVLSAFATQDVKSGGAAYDVVLSGGSQEVIEDGGIVSGLTILDGTKASVLSGGIVSGVVISGTGELDLFDFTGAAGSIRFAGTGAGTLGILQSASVLTPIDGFAVGDKLLLAGIPFDPANTVTTDGDIVSITGGGKTTSLDLVGTAGLAFQLTSRTPSGGGKPYTVLSETAPCYLAGTRILTDRGEVPVEALAIGDRVVTAFGAARPIRWIGSRRYSNKFTRNDPAIMPIRFAQGSLGGGLPRADLFVSPEHAMFIDGALIPARLLVNGHAISPCRDLATVDYYHIELDGHDILLAEGAPAESFVDCDSRGMFQNAHDFSERYPHAQATRWAFCAPRVEHGDKLAEIRRRLARVDNHAPAAGTDDRASCGHLDTATHERFSGWAWSPDDPEATLEIELLADGGVIGRATANEPRPDVREAGFGHGRYGFTFELPRPLTRYEPHALGARVCNGPALVGTIELAAARELGPESLDAIASALQAKAAGSPCAAGEVTGFLLDQLRNARGRAPRAGSAPVALVLDDRLPTPDRDAGSAALVSHVGALTRLGFRVVFVPLSQPRLRTGSVAALPDTICATDPAYASVEDVLRQHADAALVYVHRVAGMALYGALIGLLCPRARLLYALADLHFLRVGRQAAVHGRPAMLAESYRLREQELAAIRMADVTITHSWYEAELLGRLLPSAAIRVVPWEIPCRPVPSQFDRRHGLVFVGGMSHAPNLDAVRWLASDLMPRITARNPAITCTIVGAELPAADRRGLPPGMEALGPVAGLADVYGAARLAIAPLRFGAGVKGKVLESFAHGLPCVMSPVAAEGLQLPEQLHELVARDGDDLVDLVLRIHEDATSNAMLAKAGLAFVAQHASATRVDEALGMAATSSRAPLLGKRVHNRRA